MAVEIPVVVDIEGAFKDAAARVDVAMKPLQRQVNDNVLGLNFKIVVPNEQLKQFSDTVRETARGVNEGFSRISVTFDEFFNKKKVTLEDYSKALSVFKRDLVRLSQSDDFDIKAPKAQALQQAIIYIEQYLANYDRVVRLTDMEVEKQLSVTRAADERNFVLQREVRSISDINDRLSALRAKLDSLPRAGKDISSEWAKTGREIRKATAELAKFEAKYTKVTTKPGSINRLSAEMQALTEKWNAMSKAQKFDKDGNLKASAQRVVDKFRELTIESEKFGRSLAETAKAGAVETRKIGDNVRDVNAEMGRSNSHLMTLIKNSARLIALHAATRFVRNIREVTAEFELQRVALGSIIQDTERAEGLFKQIKAAAIQSPFEIKDLVTYTKQLSAYQIETEKLFDTTMKLADISAGLGVDMSRLILAFGQVRAAAVLRGQELRQFTESGIPLVDKLAQKFSELNGRAVSTAEVFELISKRAVPFAMIEEIFNDLTSAGGAFYKMQEKQAETLLGQWNNLKDAISIMYDEIGNTTPVHSAMEDLISGAKTLMQNWRFVGNMVAWTAVQYGVMKGATAFLPILARDTKLLERAELAEARAKRLQEAAHASGSKLLAKSAQSLRAYTYYTIMAARATTGFGRALNLTKAFFVKNWVGLAVTAVTLLTSALISARIEASRLQKELAGIGSEGLIKADQSVRNFERLAKAVVGAAAGSKEQKDAVDELVRTYGDLLPASDKVVEKLISMKGNYDSLTEAIRQKINMQIREQKIDTITSEYSKKIGGKQDRLKKLLKEEGLSTAEISAVMAQLQTAVNDGLVNTEQDIEEQAQAIEKIIYEYTGKYVKLLESFYQYGAYYQGETATPLSRNFGSLVGLWSDMNDAIQEVDDSMAGSIGVIGKYASEWKDLQKEIANYAGVGKTQFARSEDEIRNRVERSIKFIQDKFKDANVDISQAIVNGVPKFDIIKSLADQIEDSSAATSLRSIVGDFQKTYEKLELSDDLRNAIKSKLMDISESTGISMDKFTSYIKAAGADSKAYIKEIEDAITKYRDDAQETANLIAQGAPADTSENRAKVKEYNDMADALQVLFDWLSKIIKVQSTPPKKDPLTNLRQGISDITNAYKKFQELRKYKGKDEALIDIGKLFPQLKGWEPTLDNVIDKLQGKLKEVREKLAKAPKDKTLLDMQRALETEISNLKFDDLKNGIEDKLKRLSDEIKRSEAARNFYRDIFDLTGDETLSTSLAVEVYGGVGAEFRDRLQQQLNAVLSNISADADLSRAFQTQDFGYILDHLAQIPEKWHKEIKDLADAQQKFSADQIKTWLNELKKERDFSEQRVALARQTAERIAEIKATENLSDDEQRAFIEQYRKRERDQAAKLRYEAFKDNPLYIQMFGNLESASEEMLRAMKKNIKDMMSEWKNLDPTQLKEMQSRLQELDSQLARKNPFKVLGESVKKYNELVKAGRSKQSDTQKMVDDAKNLSDAENKLAKLITDLTAAEDAYKAAVDEFDEDSIQASAALEQKEALEQLVAQLTELIKKLRQSANASANAAGEWNVLGNNAKGAADEIEQWGQSLLSAVGAAEQFVGVFSDKGADVVKRISDITDSAVKLGAAIAKVAGSEGADLQAWAQAAANIITMTAQIVDWIAAANLEKWNDQIAEQDKLVRRLERSYSKLERAMEKSFGSDYVYNYNEAMKELEAMQEAYAKEIEIQNKIAREASKQEDRDAASERESELEDEVDKVEQRQSELRTGLAEFFTGTSLTSAAEEFATAWLDAYRSFGNTTDAIKQKMEDMINNLIVKSSLAKAAEVVLEPFFRDLEAAAETNTLTEQIPALISLLNQKTGDLNDALNALAQVWQANGISFRGTVGNLSGISRDIASASEESILALTAGINTQNFYMSYMPTISADVRQIVEIMSGSTGQTVTQTAPPEGAVMPSIQEMLYRDMPVIKSHLSNIESLLSKVITTGTNTGWYVATKM